MSELTLEVGVTISLSPPAADAGWLRAARRTRLSLFLLARYIAFDATHALVGLVLMADHRDRRRRPVLRVAVEA